MHNRMKIEPEEQQQLLAHSRAITEALPQEMSAIAVGQSGQWQQRLDRVEDLLWHGNVEAAIAQFYNWRHERVERFVAYFNKHRARIVNYDYYHSEGISIGSGALESTVKQIGRRLKISGAQWKPSNVPQVLQHRCAYLNGVFST